MFNAATIAALTPFLLGLTQASPTPVRTRLNNVPLLLVPNFPIPLFVPPPDPSSAPVQARDVFSNVTVLDQSTSVLTALDDGHDYNFACNPYNDAVCYKRWWDYYRYCHPYDRKCYRDCDNYNDYQGYCKDWDSAYGKCYDKCYYDHDNCDKYKDCSKDDSGDDDSCYKKKRKEDYCHPRYDGRYDENCKHEPPKDYCKPYDFDCHRKKPGYGQPGQPGYEKPDKPDEPVYDEPEEPGYGQPEQPGYGKPDKPDEPDYEKPEEPGYGQPEQPGYGKPDKPNEPDYEEPEEPGYGQPKQPGYGKPDKPDEPDYDEPEEPGYGQPEQPGYGKPDKPDEPVYDKPGHDEPEKPGDEYKCHPHKDKDCYPGYPDYPDHGGDSGDQPQQPTSYVIVEFYNKKDGLLFEEKVWPDGEELYIEHKDELVEYIKYYIEKEDKNVRCLPMKNWFPWNPLAISSYVEKDENGYKVRSIELKKPQPVEVVRCDFP